MLIFRVLCFEVHCITEKTKKLKWESQVTFADKNKNWNREYIHQKSLHLHSPQKVDSYECTTLMLLIGVVSEWEGKDN